MLDFELIQKIIEAQVKCTYWNEEYVILYKAMDVVDSLLEEYFARMACAQESGIRIPKVVDYLLLEEVRCGIRKGIFVEERAPGEVLNVRGLILKNDSDDFEKVIEEYLGRVAKYLQALEKRAEADQEMYDQFVDDFFSLYDFGLRPDPNSLNYLFDRQSGFSIIDPYYNDFVRADGELVFRYIMNAVYGVSRPVIWLKGNRRDGFYELSCDFKKRLEECSQIINQKIGLSFVRRGYSMEWIERGVELNGHRFYSGEKGLEKDEMIDGLRGKFGGDFLKRVKRL